MRHSYWFRWNRRQRAALITRLARNFYRLKAIRVIQIHLAGDRVVGKIDDDKQFILVVGAQKGDEVGLVRVMQPVHARIAQRGILMAQLNQVVVDTA